MTLAQLEAFCAVVETGSFSKAAQILYVSQPAVTANIRKLEECFGAPLLRRLRGRAGLVVPTEPGRIVYEKAKVILKEFKEIEEFKAMWVTASDVLQAGDRSALMVRVLASLNVATYFFPEVCTTMRKLYPRCVISIETYMTPNVVTSLLEKKVFDLLFVPYRRLVEASDRYNLIAEMGIEIDATFYDPIVLVGTRAVKTSITQPIPWHLLGSLDLVIPPCSTLIRKTLDQYFLDNKLEPRIIMEISPPELIKKVVRGSSNVLAFLPYSSVRAEIMEKSLMLLPTETPLPRIEYVIGHLRQRGLSYFSQKLVEAFCFRYLNAVTKNETAL